MTIKSKIEDHIVFVDTSSLMHPDAETAFLKNKDGIVGENRILIPIEVGDEINSLIAKANPNKMPKAKKAKTIFDTLRNKKLIEVGKHKDAKLVDNIFISLFTRNRLRHKLCLITQDKTLAREILQLSKSKSVKYQKGIIVLQLQDGGRLTNFNTERPHIPLPSIIKAAPFSVARKPKKLENRTPIVVREVPVENSYVYIENRKKPIQLTKRINKGGEGTIYETNYEKYICKIFKDKSRNNFKKEKLRLMTSRKLTRRGICWPISLVYNSYAEFVGFAMPRARGVEIQKSIFIKYHFLKKFPGWKKLDLINISLDLLHKIRILHEHNVLIGDINPRNILITEDKKTFFVDTDSYQVGGYPCPVGMVNFTAPEIQDKDFKTFLRTKEQEKFALATILFMILIPGKTPYSHQGGESPAKNIKLKSFPYPLGEIKSKNLPKGPWRFIWSHLPYYIKVAFFNLFHDGKRLEVTEWIDLLKRYRSDLNKGFVSNEIYDSTYKEYK